MLFGCFFPVILDRFEHVIPVFLFRALSPVFRAGGPQLIGSECHGRRSDGRSRIIYLSKTSNSAL